MVGARGFELEPVCGREGGAAEREPAGEILNEEKDPEGVTAQESGVLKWSGREDLNPTPSAPGQVGAVYCACATSNCS
jgi:hypothetical protein